MTSRAVRPTPGGRRINRHQGEVVKKAADAWRRTKLTPGVKKLFAAWFRVFR